MFTSNRRVQQKPGKLYPGIWWVLFIVTYSAVIVRLVDFIDEAATARFHMYRLGMHVEGSIAFTLQAGLILGGAIVVCWSLSRLKVLPSLALSLPSPRRIVAKR